VTKTAFLHPLAGIMLFIVLSEPLFKSENRYEVLSGLSFKNDLKGISRRMYEEIYYLKFALK